MGGGENGFAKLANEQYIRFAVIFYLANKDNPEKSYFYIKLAFLVASSAETASNKPRHCDYCRQCTFHELVNAD